MSPPRDLSRELGELRKALTGGVEILRGGAELLDQVDRAARGIEGLPMLALVKLLDEALGAALEDTRLRKVQLVHTRQGDWVVRVTGRGVEAVDLFTTPSEDQARLGAALVGAWIKETPG